MSANVYKYNMPSGIPGAISRAGGGVVLDVEPVALSSAEPFPFYGLAGSIDANGDFQIVQAADMAIYGFLSRPFPDNQTTTANFFGSNPLGTPAVPPQNGGEGAALRAGYMTVQLYGATAAAKNGVVYVRTQNAGAGQQIGGVEAAADGGNTIAVNAVFMGPADDNGIVEISFNVSKN